jgi:uncharacterized protein with HEPN domain
LNTSWRKHRTFRRPSSELIATSDKASSARLEIISEASRLLPAALKETKPEISWRKVADFGNVLRHAYFGVNSDIVLRIAKDDLVPLRDALLSMRHNLDC